MNIRRIFTTAVITVAAAGLASANTIAYTASSGAQTTDFNYNLLLNKWDNTLGYTLTGVTLYLYASESVSSLTLTNNSGSEQDAFQAIANSNFTNGATNTAFAADKYANEIAALYDTGVISLGATGGACAFATPSTNCSSVSYAPPVLTVDNTDGSFGTVGTGVLGVTGVQKNILASHWGSYSVAGLGTFALTGGTQAQTTFIGGGGNLAFSQNTNGIVTVEVDYTYTVPSGTPEPASMVLMGSALVGLGFLRKRFKS